MKEITEKQKLLYRFYKENNLYFLYRNTNDIEDCNFFNNSFSWMHTKEGHLFWLKMQCNFILFLIENDKNYVVSSADKLKTSFSMYLKHYFHHYTTPYKKYLNKYIELYGTNP